MPTHLPRATFAAVLLATAACGGTPASGTPSPASTTTIAVASTAEDLVRQMHARYDGSWYRTLTFVQRNTRYLQSGAADTSTWYEAVRIPGALRIDIAPLSQRNGILFASDSQYSIRNALVTDVRPSVHPLMVLGFDVYADAPTRTLARLRSIGIDLSKLRQDSWQGRPVYVVGAAAGDMRTRQFWIDRERLVFVRLLQPGRDSSAVEEIRFDGYRPLGRGWIAPEVLFLTNGKATFRERYEDVRADVTLPDATFDPRAWSTSPHWTTIR